VGAVDRERAAIEFPDPSVPDLAVDHPQRAELKPFTSNAQM
jgi:hypothetical protein